MNLEVTTVVETDAVETDAAATDVVETDAVATDAAETDAVVVVVAVAEEEVDARSALSLSPRQSLLFPSFPSLPRISLGAKTHETRGFSCVRS